ncbi:sporulation protein [Nocardioides sp. KC13]|uniref:Sporulation protein n=1 Tax=Nocardioides turkmenicus TaxID=2711220 RepID=A0A6M1R301_9ACTN|nr:phosphodiester glycosidase family protein [Nocardioides sp. KC13]NGN92068.1 sporulation protein [Nocardioides sp. KC13]
MPKSARLLASGVALAAVVAVVPGAAHAGASASAPTDAWTDEIQWTSRSLADGVTLRTGVLDDPDSEPFWTVTVQHPVTSSITGRPAAAGVGPRAWAEETADRLRAAGHEPRLDDIPWPDYSDTPSGLQGVRVRTGEYASQAEAGAAVTALKAQGFSTAVAAWTGYDVDTPADAERIHVAVIDQRAFDGEVYGTHHGVVAQRQRLSDVSGELGATVAVNGGFFITADADGYQGAPAGIAAYDGRLEAMDAGSRTGIVLGNGPARITRLTAKVDVRSGGSVHPVNGINRKPGVIRNCGRPGATPTTEPRQDVTCRTESELVLFTPRLGTELPTGEGTQVVLDEDDVVTAVGARGGTVPDGGSVIQGIGGAGEWLAARARVGSSLPVAESVRDADGHRVPLTPDTSIVSAAPNLVTDGRTDIDAAEEGVIDPADLSFNYAWAEIRQPRTMAGIDRRGRLLLVTVDGRQPGVSEGLTLAEEAKLMKSLGAEDAMNLDGGGSTAMASGGTLLNRTSDAAGERADGDFIVAVPTK